MLRSGLLSKTLASLKDQRGLCWLESQPGGFIIHNSPLQNGERLRHLLAACNNSWAFTSASISVQGSAERFLKPLGLNKQAYQLSTGVTLIWCGDFHLKHMIYRQNEYYSLF